MEDKDQSMIIVGECAFDLHMKQSEELICDLPVEDAENLKSSHKETDDFVIDGNTLRFPSIEARNRCVAAYVFQKNRQAFSDDAQKWIGTAYDLWRCEIGMADSASGGLLSFVNESEDIFSIAASAIENESMQVFDVLHVVEAALPYISNLPVDGIFTLCSAQHEQTKNDLAAGMFFNNIEKVLVVQPDTCKSIHVRLRSEISEATAGLYTVVFSALAKSLPNEAVKLALEDTQAANIILKSAALWTLGRLLALTIITADAIPAVSAIVIMNMSNPVERVRHAAITVAAHAVPVIGAFDDTLTKLGESGDQDVLAAIAGMLMMNTNGMKGTDSFNKWVRLLCKLLPETKGGIDNFDSVLYQLISDESQQQFVISCLTDWVQANADNSPKDKSMTKLFDSTTSKLIKHPALLSQIITDWFLSDSRRLASAAAGLLSYLGVHGLKNPEYSSSRLDLSELSDLLFLARRTLGYVYSENHLLSLTMSFLKTKDAEHRTFGIVRSLFVEEIGQDFPESTVEALEAAKKLTEESELIAFYSSIIEAIESRIRKLEALPRLSELRPPPSLQRQFAKARAKQMNTMAEESQKQSIFHQLVTHIPIKAGIGSFSFHDGGYTDTSYLQSFSHQVAVPRRHAIDTVGYEISRLLFRLAKRGES
ncbi:MAG: hypothetical protein HZB61_06025 [Nitrospirae bacterium]|nr:hypothetical protein [Nitrospirota bacterium]